MSSLIPNFTDDLRQVLFDDKNSVIAVQTANRYGANATTFQLEERSYRYGLSTKRKGKLTIDAYTRAEDGFAFTGRWSSGQKMTSSEVAIKLTLIPKDILAYLKWEGTGLIPAGYGWDGKHTNFELARANRVKQLIIGDYDFKGITNEVIEKIAQDIMTSKSDDLILDWEKAIPFTDKIYPLQLNHDSELFVFYQNENLSIRKELTCPQKIDFIVPDQEYDRVVVIITKYNTSNRYGNHGAAMELYERVKK